MAGDFNNLMFPVSSGSVVLSGRPDSSGPVCVIFWRLPEWKRMASM